MRNPFRSSRFVLVIGDDGALLVQMAGRQVRDAWFVGGDDPDGPEALAPYLAGDRKAPVAVLVDVLEQVYREEELPPVGPLDRAKVLKRRLDIALPHDQMKAALPVRKTGSKGRAYLFAALPLSDRLLPWLAFLTKQPNPFHGFSLLPLEASGLARRLAGPAPQDQARSWFALVSQQVTGGFRQIIETEGRLVVTRLTQAPVTGTPAPEVAAQIDREFRSTLTYIKRMGYVDGDHLDLVVLAEPAVVAAIQHQPLPATRVAALTPYQAGQQLGLHRVADVDSGFADALHAACAAQARPTLVLATPAMRQSQAMARATRWTGRAAAVAAAGTLGMAVATYVETVNLDQSLAAAQRQLSAAQQAKAAVDAELAKLPLKLAEMKAVVDTYDQLGTQSLDLPPVLTGLAQALGEEARLDRLDIDVPAPLAEAGATGGRRPQRSGQDDKDLQIRMSVRFLSALPDRQDAVAASYRLLERLRQAFPRYRIEVTRLPVPILPGDVLAGDLDAGPEIDARSADYLIRGGA